MIYIKRKAHLVIHHTDISEAVKLFNFFDRCVDVSLIEMSGVLYAYETLKNAAVAQEHNEQRRNKNRIPPRAMVSSLICSSNCLYVGFLCPLPFHMVDT